MQTSLIAACFLAFGAVVPSTADTTLSPGEVCLFLPRTPLLAPNPQDPPAPPKTGGEANQDEGAKKAKSDANVTWAAWWFFNDDRFLNLRAKVRAAEAETDIIQRRMRAFREMMEEMR